MASTEQQPAIPALAPDATGQVRPALTAPAGYQGVEPGDMARGQRARRAAGRDRGVPEHPRPDRRRQGGHGLDGEPGPGRRRTFWLGFRERVEEIGVAAQLAVTA